MKPYDLRTKTGRRASRNTGLAILALLFLLALMAAGDVQHRRYLDGLIEPYCKEIEVQAVEPTPTPTLEEEIEAFGEDLFTSDWPLMRKIIKCESGWRPEVESSTGDCGLTQINWVHGIRKDWLKDWRINLSVAHKLFRDQGTTPWNSSKHCWAK